MILSNDWSIDIYYLHNAHRLLTLRIQANIVGVVIVLTSTILGATPG